MDMTSTSVEVPLNILKRCFPKADNVRIINNILEDGDLHFTSNVTRFTVEYEQDHKTHQKHLVIKVPTSASIFTFFERLDFFDREISMYEEVIPRINKYLDKSLAPAHLYTTDSKILVLEDLIARDYESGEKLPLLDFDQAKGILKAFANFHAASHKLHQDDSHLLQNLLATHMLGIEARRIVINMFAPFLFELLKRKSKTALIAKVKAAIVFLEKDDDEIRAIINQSNFKFVVLNHGDSRKDNVLLKCDSNGQVESVQFIDFQTCLWSSPLLDIFYFFATSVSIDVIEAHLEDLLNVYLHELNERLKKMDCSCTYERADFDEDFKTLRIFLFSCVLCLCFTRSPIDRKKKENIFVQPEPDVDYICDISLNDEAFVHAVYSWLKYCEKSKVFDFVDECSSVEDKVPLEGR